MTENNGGNAPLPLADVRVLECCQTIMGPSAGLAVVVGGPMPLNAGLQKARTAAAAQGMCSGSHPAITELMAAFSTVTWCSAVRIRPGPPARKIPPTASMASMEARAGDTTGSPPGYP